MEIMTLLREGGYLKLALVGLETLPAAAVTPGGGAVAAPAAAPVSGAAP